MRVGEVAKQLGVTSSTVRKYSNEGRLHFELNPGGHRIYTQQDIDDFLGKKQTITKAFYVRSSSGDKNLIQSQIDELTKNYGEPDFLYKDSGSGLNDNRKNLQKLIKDAQEKKFNTLYVTYEDRLARFGVPFLRTLLEQNNVELIVLHDKVKYSVETELMQDFMSLIASFSGKFYRMRSKESQRKLIDKASQELCDE